jgi:hypothetical protein
MNGLRSHIRNARLRADVAHLSPTFERQRRAVVVQRGRRRTRPSSNAAVVERERPSSNAAVVERERPSSNAAVVERERPSSKGICRYEVGTRMPAWPRG